MSGLDKSQTEICAGYKKFKRLWANNNPGLSRAEAKDRMNVEMCAHISSARDLARSRVPAAALEATRRYRRQERRKKAALAGKKASPNREDRLKKKKKKSDALQTKQTAAKDKAREKARVEKKKQKAADDKARDKANSLKKKQKAADDKIQKKARADRREKEKQKAAKDKSNGKSNGKSKDKGKEKSKDKSNGNSTAPRTSSFFAERDVPRDWSIHTHVADMFAESDDVYNFTHPDRSGVPQTRLLFKDSVDDLVEEDNWIDSSIVDAYMVLLGGPGNKAPRCNFMPSDLYKFWSAAKSRKPAEKHQKVKYLTDHFDPTAPGVRTFIPTLVNGNHWFLIYVDVTKKRVMSLDSFGIKRSAQRAKMMAWIKQEHISRNHSFEGWKSEHVEGVPLQKNKDDCGIYTCLYAAYLSNTKPLNFTQDDLPKLRRRLGWSILHARL